MGEARMEEKPTAAQGAPGLEPVPSSTLELARLAAVGDSVATGKLLKALTPRLVRVVRAVLGGGHPETIGRAVGAGTCPSPQPSPHREERWGEGARERGRVLTRVSVEQSLQGQEMTIGRAVGAGTCPSPQPSPHREERWGEGARERGAGSSPGFPWSNRCGDKQRSVARSVRAPAPHPNPLPIVKNDGERGRKSRGYVESRGLVEQLWT